MLHFKCPSCQANCEAAPEFAGKLAVCPKCGHSVSVPSGDGEIVEGEPPWPMQRRAELAKNPGPSVANDVAHTWLRNAIYLALVLGVVAVGVALLVLSVKRAREGAAQAQSTNNLKQIAAACNVFVDVNKRLPFNGSDLSPVEKPEVQYSQKAVSGRFESGSWGFQISPFIDSAPLLNNLDLGKNAGIAAYMCPGRGRPMFEVGGGIWTDYFYNNYLNDPLQAAKPDAPDARRTMLGITDGSSFTILAGHGNINTEQYAATADVVGSTNIFLGGTTGTMRSGDNGVANPTGVVLKRDSAEDPGIGSWGGPFPQGGLMGMADGTVRMFPYSMQNFGAFLTPTGGENVALPDT